MASNTNRPKPPLRPTKPNFEINDSVLMQDNLLGDVSLPPGPDPRPSAKEVPEPQPLPQLSARVSHRKNIQTAGRFVLAIDYGTTFTGFASAHASSSHAKLEDIELLQEWTSNMSNQSQVPSVISYSECTQGAVQWGSDFTDEAITISRTKLEFEPQPALEELDMLFQVLKGTGLLTFAPIRDAGENPAYTSKDPEQIVEDYLRKVFECASNEIDLAGIEVTGVPIDIVLTVPVGWSYEAYKSMFRAMRSAGFNKTELPTLQHTLMLTEAEAASYYTARDMAQNQSLEFLAVDNCFILCDAGGGTVDLVSFQVKQMHPHLELEIATEPKGGRYGSSLIDNAFKQWLKGVIGTNRYSLLDPENATQERISPHTAETSRMRDVIKHFNAAKAEFTGQERSDIRLDLSKSLGNVSMLDRMDEGHLIIHRHEMKKLMDPCITGVINLIRQQIEQVSSSKQRRVRDILLVGGFGASPYLQRKLKDTPTVKENKIGLRRPNDPLTAVVQGAIIYGVEKDNHAQATYMSAISKTYGVVFQIHGVDRFEWLIRRGDLALSNKDTIIRSSPFFAKYSDCVRGCLRMKLFTYQQRGPDDDNTPEFWKNGQHEVDTACSIDCDLSDSRDRSKRVYPSSLTPGRGDSKLGPLRWELSFRSEQLHVSILLKETPIGSQKLALETDFLPRRKKTIRS